MDNNFSVYIHHNLINHKVYVGKTGQKKKKKQINIGGKYGSRNY